MIAQTWWQSTTEWVENAVEWLQEATNGVVTAVILGTALRIAALLVIGLPVVWLISRIMARMARRRWGDQSAMIVRKMLLYTGVVIILISVLGQLGYQLTALLGAAGVAAIAIGFAAQTSLSNLISGMFLIGEKPFQVGDIIKVGEVVGVVLSVDLLSVKIRAFDNRYIRIPNETMVKTEVTNYTRFPIRRVDIDVGVAYKEDVARVQDVLKDIATNNPLCLDEPEPLILFTKFGDSSLNFLFGVWCQRSDWLTVKNELMRQIKERFDAEDIEIPFPHRTLYTGAVTDPLPVRMVGAADAEG